MHPSASVSPMIYDPLPVALMLAVVAPVLHAYVHVPHGLCGASVTEVQLLTSAPKLTVLPVPVVNVCVEPVTVVVPSLTVEYHWYDVEYASPDQFTNAVSPELMTMVPISWYGKPISYGNVNWLFASVSY